MPRASEKWFSLRTDLFGADTYVLGIMQLSPQAVGAYFAAAAYVTRFIHPYSKGGTDDPDNLRVLCRSCNSRKGARI